MRILMISAEGPPLARATALVDVLEALPRELRARKHEVGIAMPYYREISENMALVPVFVADQKLPFATTLTIHHLAEQGSFWGLDFGLTNLPERYFKPQGVEYFGRLNLLKGGIVFADKITTVSERYRREMLSPEGGCGLDIVLREHAHRLVGVLNGAVYQRWNPETDYLL